MKGKNKLKDKDWRISHLYRIRDKNEQIVTFKPNRAQFHFSKHAHTRNIVLKSRQLGFTTFEAIDSLDDSLWKPNFKALMISYDKESALDIFDDKINLAWLNYPEKFKALYNLDADRANKLKFGFGDNTFSEIIVRNRGRSGTFNRIHISEFAKTCKESQRKAKEIITGTLPAVPIDGRIDIESTAEGVEGYFYDMFWTAWERKQQGKTPLPTEFEAHFYNWTWDDEEIAKITEPIPASDMEDSARFTAYQQQHKLSDIQITYYYLKWKGFYDTCKNRQEAWDLTFQEYPTTPEEAFVASTNIVIPKAYVEQQRNYIRQPIRMMDDVEIYEDVVSDHYYSLGGDPSNGKGKDDAAFTVLDRMTGREVASYANSDIQPDMFARKMVKVALYFNNAVIVPEMNIHSLTILNTFSDEGYSNIFRQRFYDKASKEYSYRLGWHTSSKTKPLMVDDFIQAVREDEIGLSCSATINQMSHFVHSDEPDSHGMGAVSGKKDDRLISSFLANQGLKDLPNKFKYS